MWGRELQYCHKARHKGQHAPKTKKNLASVLPSVFESGGFAVGFAVGFRVWRFCWRLSSLAVFDGGFAGDYQVWQFCTIIMAWVSKERVNMAVSSDVLSSGVLTPWLIGHMTPQMIDVSTCEISTTFENKSSASANYRLENHQEIFHAKTDVKTARLENRRQNRRQNRRALFGACRP